MTVSLLLLFQFLYGLVTYFPHSVPLISIVARAPTMKFSILFFLPVSLHLLFQFSSYVSFIFKFSHGLLPLDIPVKIQSSPNSLVILNSSSPSMYLSSPLFSFHLPSLQRTAFLWPSFPLALGSAR